MIHNEETPAGVKAYDHKLSSLMSVSSKHCSTLLKVSVLYTCCRLTMQLIQHTGLGWVRH